MSAADLVALIAVAFCLFVSFFFSGSETALTASSRATMARLARDGDPNAAIVNRLLEDRERMIGALLGGNNVATIVASSLATGLMLNWFGDVGVIYATGVMTVLIVVFCEVLPKTAAIDSPDRFALTAARPIYVMVRILTPVLAAVPWVGPKILDERGFQERGERADALPARGAARRGRSAASRGRRREAGSRHAGRSPRPPGPHRRRRDGRAPS